MTRCKTLVVIVALIVVAVAATVWVCSGPGSVDGGGGLDAALLAYQDGDLTRAKRIAVAHRDQAAGRLVFHLCQVHDVKDQDLSAGLAGLKALFEDDTVPLAVRAEAALGYGRVIQIFQARKMNQDYADIDVRGVYRRVIELVPQDIAACTAARYLAESYMGAKTFEKGLEFVEDFLANYAGPPEHTIPVHLFVEAYYIDGRGDYAKAMTHLKTAYDLGIIKDTVRRKVLFRMGRICDTKLKDIDKARTYYREFLERYPQATQAPVIRRYLNALG